MRERIGRYRIERQLGEGGMGVVYAAHDDRLHRHVAIKTIRSSAAELVGRERMWREARAAAAVAHPNVCQVYEVGEEDDTIFIVMELLAGEPLSSRLERGPIPVGEAAPIALGVLAALEALHGRGIVHRDLKPANVFLTPHGVKLLDFGLAQTPGVDATQLEVRLTATGTLVGTPRYMAPEQLEGGQVSAASDQFAFGAILFEMLMGRPAFGGTSVWTVSHAILHDPTPSLSLTSSGSALAGIVRRCLAKRPAERFPDPAAIAREIRAVVAGTDSGEAQVPRRVVRLMVLPFKLLRPDPEIDFLSFSLADALIVSLTGIGSLVVRSSHVGQQFAAETLDLRRIAVEAEVDAVLTGSILRAGDQVRLVAQLVETPGGAVLWSNTAQVRMSDVFQLQDDLVRQVIESLRVPLSRSDRARLSRDVPASGRAYELYLRANHLAHGTINQARLLAARELYTACLEEDPHYAPAWARLGRVCRVLVKYAATSDDEGLRRARDAFDRAFALNPDLPLAHHLYTYFEVEQLGQAEAAMTRLLRVAQAIPNDADLFTGLVIACRYCGLLEASLAADLRARQLDPTVQTSILYTYQLLNDRENADRFAADDSPFVRCVMLLQAGALDEGRALIPRFAEYAPVEGMFGDVLLAALDGRKEDFLKTLDRVRQTGFRDPEGLCYFALAAAQAGVADTAMDLLEDVIDRGFVCPQVRSQPWFQSLVGHERFEGLIARAEAARARALAAFRSAGGERVLGISAVPAAAPPETSDPPRSA